MELPQEYYDNLLIRAVKEKGIDVVSKALKTTPTKVLMAMEEVRGDYDFPFFAKTQLKIEDNSKIVPFTLNQAQVILEAEIRKQKALNRPVRLIHLKPRQYGATTFFVAYIYRELKRKKNLHATTISYSIPSAEHIRGMADRYNTLDKHSAPLIKGKSEKLWKFEKNACTWMIESSDNLNAGHSFTNQIAHVSEMGRWERDPEIIMRGLTSTIQALPDTMIFVESTANGFGDYFYEMWTEAKNGNSAFVPLFISWLQIEKYQMPFADDKVFDGTSKAEFERTLDDDEKRLIDVHGATLEQLHWRKYKLRELKGDVDGFREQYPATDQEAFLSSGRPYFPQTIVRVNYEKTQKEKIEQYNLVKTGDIVVEEPDQFGLWKISELPEEGYENRYVIGADPAEGKSVADDNKKKNSDYSVAYVYDRYRKKFVAQFKHRIDTDEFENEIYKANLFYNCCLVGVERNNFAGGAVIRGLKNREGINLYRKMSFGKVDDVETVEYGFYTSKETREGLLDELRRRIKANAKNEEKLIIPFYEFWEEGGTFIIDKSGKPIHQISAHDDTIFAGAIALETAIQASEIYPIEAEVSPRERAFDASPMREEEEYSNLIYAQF